ncbi:MAG: oligopeptide transporter, OPT family [Pseudomonadota bacterium]|nr:oligopeptide transporter, OPT family [Pseudomonadota bacterium]
MPAPAALAPLVLGIGLSIMLAAANAYLGLFAGLTVSASIPAAVMALAVLRLVQRREPHTVNWVQTAASAGESLAAGAIFTFPALVLIDYWDGFRYGWVTAIALLGGLLGVLFTLPLRRAMVIESPLPFPEGAATAAVVRAGTAGDEAAPSALPIAVGAALAALMKLAETGLHLWRPSAQGALWWPGGGVAYLGVNLSPALLGVGVVVGLRIAALVFAGGAIAWLLALPLDAALASAGQLREWQAQGLGPVEVAYQLWSSRIRYLGVGAMLVGGLWTLAALLPGIARSLVSMLREQGADDAVSPPVLTGIVLLLLAPLWLLYADIVGGAATGLVMTLLMALAGFLFAAVAAYMAGLVGSSHNPVSGVTIATLVLAAGLLRLLPGDLALGGPAAALLVGAAVCCAAAIAGDNMQDLKAGYLLAAPPRPQQWAQVLGVASAALFLAPVLHLLQQAYGFGPPSAAQPHALPAPQASLMAAVARGMFEGGLPWDMLALGSVLALGVIALDRADRRRGGQGVPVLAVAVGLYLPFELTAAILLGGLLGRGLSAERGVLAAAGLITGEALAGILLAVPIVIGGRADILALASAPWGPLPGVVALVAVAVWLRAAAAKGPGRPR